MATPDMTPEKLKSVMAKVDALRALAAGATTPGEAEAAAAQAAALMAKYQIGEADLGRGAGSVEAIDEHELYAASRIDRWRSVLCAGLAEIHGCYAYHEGAGVAGREQASIRLVGRPSDVEIVKYLSAWLSLEIIRLSRREHGLAKQNAFRIGAANGVVNAMKAARAKETAQASASAALVLSSRVSEAAAWLRRRLAGTGTRLSNETLRARDVDGALGRGLAAGSRIRTEGAALPGSPRALPPRSC